MENRIKKSIASALRLDKKKDKKDSCSKFCIAINDELAAHKCGDEMKDARVARGDVNCSKVDLSRMI